MQCDFSAQPGLEAIERMRTFTIEAKHVQERTIGRFDDLPKTGEPAAPAPRPRQCAIVLRRADEHGSLASLPVMMQRLTFKAGVSEVRPLRRRPGTEQRRVRRLAYSEQRLCQGLILGAAGSKAQAGDYS